MNGKKLKGQFFTTNSDYILSGLSKYVRGKNIIDPFAGDKDLIRWAKKYQAKKIIGYDIDPKYVDNKIVFNNDSINCVKKYNFVLTNPPYLHKNKATKKVKEKFFSGVNSKFEDLYQISINAILNSEEGILIVPLNFLSAENSEKMRRIFFDKFEIISLNIFWEQVFDDTTYNVVSFYYKKKKDRFAENVIKTTIFPYKEKFNLVLRREHRWQLGGEFITKIKSVKNILGVYRLTDGHLLKGKQKVKLAFNNIKDKKFYNVDKSFVDTLKRNIIFLRAIDSKNGKKIQLEDIRIYGVCGLIGKKSSRNMAYLLFRKKIDFKKQEEIIRCFNRRIERARRRYLSLFLTNFRDNNRKRISFDFAYKLINHIYIHKFDHNLIHGSKL